MKQFKLKELIKTINGEKFVVVDKEQYTQEYTVLNLTDLDRDFCEDVIKNINYCTDLDILRYLKTVFGRRILVIPIVKMNLIDLKSKVKGL